ncbi:hypothetical protein CDA63_03085 [Hymenobacter amundsenii]|uniref:Macroglobulin domain-containing protein n=1 Tax=Hymenobacter amundsenii TaxID=2006685 RepID=A0A246FPU9_9BACT|nr:hypothetical protein [Hymenobacter amundsenii]OWP64758.1 hypothetical protein CDA63_03085 [Hymenobacter amundsenii]
MLFACSRKVLGWLGLTLLLLVGLPSRAQTVDSEPADWPTILPQRFRQYQQQHLPEKLYLHLDRPAYLSGETMWFKVYAADGTTARPLSLSRVAYVEVLDDARQPLLQAKVALQGGTGHGSFQLPVSLRSGGYTVRAYTSWMQNFGADYYFHCPVTIVSTLQGLPVFSARDTASYDVHFFPEGGQLVAGIPSRVGFKITDRTGRSTAATGTVLDARGRAVAEFRTLRFGLGSFDFTPTATGSYRAVVRLPSGRQISASFPAVRPAGYVLRLAAAGPAGLLLYVRGAGLPAQNLYLLGHARQQLICSQQARLSDGQAEFLIPARSLADGVSHFTVFDQQGRPVAERLHFRPPTHLLQLGALADQARYGARTKVSLRLSATDSVARPAVADLSVAVYRLDSLSADTEASIAASFWLTSDLKGAVENPDYYLQGAGNEVAAATDNLMLTHGWSRFTWADVLAAHSPTFTYLPELYGPLVRGRVTNRATGAPAPDVMVYLASAGRPLRLTNSVSAADGRLQFEMNDFYGPHDLVAQTNTTLDSTYQIELLSNYSSRFAAGQPVSRLFRPHEHSRDDLTQHHIGVQVQNSYNRRYNTVYSLPPIDSTDFFGAPDERYHLDDYTRFPSLEEVLREYVPGVKVRLRKDGFHFTVLDNPHRTIFDDPPLVLLDGVPVFELNKLMAFDVLKIRTLDVLDRRYFQGRMMYNGIVSLRTYKGNLNGFDLDPRALVEEYEGLQVQREFYAPRYETATQRQSPLPDRRYLLYWNPSVPTGPNGQAPALDFYTADQPGIYRIVVQGLSATGAAGSYSTTFEVAPSL